MHIDNFFVQAKCHKNTHINNGRLYYCITIVSVCWLSSYSITGFILCDELYILLLLLLWYRQIEDIHHYCLTWGSGQRGASFVNGHLLSSQLCSCNTPPTTDENGSKIETRQSILRLCKFLICLLHMYIYMYWYFSQCNHA